MCIVLVFNFDCCVFCSNVFRIGAETGWLMTSYEVSILLDMMQDKTHWYCCLVCVFCLLPANMLWREWFDCCLICNRFSGAGFAFVAWWFHQMSVFFQIIENISWCSLRIAKQFAFGQVLECISVAKHDGISRSLYKPSARWPWLTVYRAHASFALLFESDHFFKKMSKSWSQHNTLRLPQLFPQNFPGHARYLIIRKLHSCFFVLDSS